MSGWDHKIIAALAGRQPTKVDKQLIAANVDDERISLLSPLMEHGTWVKEPENFRLGVLDDNSIWIQGQDARGRDGHEID